MNMHAKLKPETKPAAERRPKVPERRRFTSKELIAMEEAGILRPGERVELIDGEIITMAAKSPRHDDMCAQLANHIARNQPSDAMFTMDPAFRLSEHYEPEPDIILFPSGMLVSQVHGETALLVVEVAYSSLSTDLKIKAPIYAAHGVREYWVVDSKRLVTHVHREPRPDGYGTIMVVPADQHVTPLLVPSLTLKLAELGLEPLLDEDEPQ